jgi:AhpD family alkylhydroperoxidase
MVDEASDESFPASDPPTYSGMHAGAPPHDGPAPKGAEKKKDDGSMLDWAAYRRQLASGMKEIADKNPNLWKGYREIAAAKTADSKLDPKTRELIALAVAVTVRCDGCIATHVDLAKKRGATKEEIVDALGVAVMVNAGAAMVYSARTLDAFDSSDGPKK